MSNSRRFYDLSEELLTAFVEQLIADYNWSRSFKLVACLRKLRLVSPRFAYQDLIQKTLFTYIQFIASPEHLEHMRKPDVTRIAPFAKEILFVALPNSWTLTLSDFKEIVIAQAVSDFMEGRGCLATHYSIFEGNDHGMYIDQYWGNKQPFTDAEMDAGFQKYQAEALSLREVLLSPDLRITWTNALRQLPNLENVRFTSVKHKENPDLTRSCLCAIRRHKHNDVHHNYTCRRISAPVGEAVFAAAISSMAAARVQPCELIIGCAMTDTLAWEALEGWERLNLQRLRHLDFRPKVQTIGESLDDCEGGSDSAGRRAAEALASILRKCNTTIEKLDYASFDTPMLWPGDDVIDLPKLDSLSLGSGTIRPESLNRWLAQMSSLKHLEFGMTSAEGPLTGWRHVFDAIRDHPNRMQVEFDQSVANSGAELSLSYYTGNFEYVAKRPEYLDPWVDVDWLLALYLSGRGEFDEGVQEWLEA